MPNGHLSLQDLERMRIPKRYYMSSISQIEGENRKLAERFVDLIKNNKNFNGGLLLFGLPGRGKHYLAVSILKRLRAEVDCFRGLFVDAEEVDKNFLNAEYDEGETFEDRMKDVDLLVIGRFGFESYENFLRIFEIVRSRIDDMKNTIIVSVLTNKEDIENKYPGFLPMINGPIIPTLIKGKDYNEIEKEKIKSQLIS